MRKIKSISENDKSYVPVIPKGFRIVGVKVWQPNVGECLEGVFLGSKKRKSHTKGKDGKGEFLSYEIAAKDTGECFAVSGSALEQRFSEIEVDEKVFLVYNGKRKSAQGRNYHDFDVYKGDAKS